MSVIAPKRIRPAPRVSVLLPVYNAATHLHASVKSILEQTFRNFQLIVINDGSTDGSLSIMKSLAAKDDRVWIVTRPNTGLVGALQDGLAAAHAPLLARMDADDIALPERFARQVEYMDAHPECVLLGTRVRAIDPHGLTLWDESTTPTDHASLDRELMKGRGGVIRHPSVMMRRDAVERVGGYRKQYDCAEDCDLFLRLAEIGQVANLPEILLLYRQHYKSINRTKFELQAGRVTGAVHEAAKRRGITLPPDWKYQPSPPTPVEKQIHDWGWLALKHKRADIARKHAWSLLGMHPTSFAAWRLMACALRGY